MNSSGKTRIRSGHRRAALGSIAVMVVLVHLLVVGGNRADGQPRLRDSLTPLLVALPDLHAVATACVIDLTRGRTVFEHDPDHPLIPASTLKVLVMGAAATELGQGFSFQTVLATDGRSLLIVGDGDPATGDPRLCKGRDEPITALFDRWGDAVSEAGVEAIAGDLVFDDSIFEERRLHPSWEASDLGKWYAVPVGGLNFNDNCLNITLSPAAKLDDPVRVLVVPETSVVRILNHCKTGGKAKPILHHLAGSDEYIIRGRCGKRWPFGPVSFPDPGLLFADSFRVVLAKRGISLGGKVVRRRIVLADGSLPEPWRVIGRYQTPLADVLSRIGKNSQNLFADCLLKRLGYERSRRLGETEPQGSWASGSAAVVDWLKRSGIDATGLAIADGSGLSRDNRCTARQLVAVMAWMSRQPEAALFRSSLSVAGVDGSLRKRLKNVRGRVVGKTGTMRGVRTLAGYVMGEAGPAYAFAVLFNGYKGPSTPYKEIQDRFCRALLADAATHAETR